MADMIKLIDDVLVVSDDEERRRASLSLARYAKDKDELLDWLDMLGLPPCEREIRTVKKNEWRSRQ